MEKNVPQVQGFNKDTLMGMLKSKTININVFVTLIIIGVANTYGVPLTPVEAAAIVSLLYGVVNVILRFFTDKSLPEKGIVIENPKKVRDFVTSISQDEESLKELYIALAKWKNEKKKEGKFSQAMRM